MENDRRFITAFNRVVVNHCFHVAMAERRKTGKNMPLTDRRKKDEYKNSQYKD